MNQSNRSLHVAIAVLALGAAGSAAHAQSIITDWNFGTLAATAPDNTPAPTTGSGSATSIGMTNDYTYPENQSGSGGSVTGSTTYDDITSDSGVPGVGGNGDVWRIRGNPSSGGNGWNNSAPEYTQGVQFMVNTSGYSNIILSFNWASTTQGIANMQVQYTTNGGTTWTNVGSLLTATIDSSSGGGYTTDTINFGSLGITAANNDANFGVQLVSAYNPTLGSEYASATSVASGSPKQYNDYSGNWRFSDVQVDGTQTPVPLPAAAWLLLSGAGGMSAFMRKRRGA